MSSVLEGEAVWRNNYSRSSITSRKADMSDASSIHASISCISSVFKRIGRCEEPAWRKNSPHMVQKRSFSEWSVLKLKADAISFSASKKQTKDKESYWRFGKTSFSPPRGSFRISHAMKLSSLSSVNPIKLRISSSS